MMHRSTHCTGLQSTSYRAVYSIKICEYRWTPCIWVFGFVKDWLRIHYHSIKRIGMIADELSPARPLSRLPDHYLDQWWLIINHTTRIRLQRILSKITFSLHLKWSAVILPSLCPYGISKIRAASSHYFIIEYQKFQCNVSWSKENEFNVSTQWLTFTWHLACLLQSANASYPYR